MIEFNINDDVYVKLTDTGRQIHRANFEKIFKGTHFIYHAPVEDEEGCSKWQMWDLMYQFGAHIGPGSKIPFETNIKLDTTHHD